jgi:hypothetical protein
MTQTLQELKDASAALDIKIRNHFKPFEGPNKLLITDGIVNMDQYFNSPIKIMWILKEPYDLGNSLGGGWCMREGLNGKRANGENKDSHTTWHPITYVTYGILNNYCRYEKMPKINADVSMNSYLRKIAFINVNKLPANTTTNSRLLSSTYQMNKEILIEQINTYKPNIVIGGSTLHLLKKDLQIRKEQELDYGHFHKDGIVFIDAKHPGQRTKTRDEYVNRIIYRAEGYKHFYTSI